uniref:von Willebrand domain containing protein n=4 Tax=viral metagenome TaxID=1070528 RepID=A0A6M3J5R4_9ZZZZ
MARSENWRINKSSLIAVEGAQLLKALQKVAGAAGLPKDYAVKFATKAQMSGIDFDGKELVIGAGRIFQEAPLPADKMDVLVGLALHEVGHYTIQTNRVWDSMSRNNVNAQEESLFQHFVNIGEDIVIESMTRANPNLADYDKALFDWATTQLREAKPHKLLELWIEYGLGHKVNYDKMDNLPEELKEAMRRLVSLTGWLRKVPMYYIDRAHAYLSYWKAVKDAILNPPKPPQPQEPQQDAGAEANPDQKSDSGSAAEPSAPAPDNQSELDKDNSGSSTSGAEPESQQKLGENTGAESSAPEKDDSVDQNAGNGDSDDDEDELDRPLAPTDEDDIDDDLASAINDAVETEQEDITEEVQNEFNGIAQQDVRYPIIRSRETKTPLVKPDPQLRKRLERIMTIRKRLQARTMHGEQYGRIDKRHLHRIGTDQRVFSLRYKFPDGFPNTRILIDLSGSMGGREADEVLEAAGALQSLVNAEVWCYNRTGHVNLVRMDDGKLIHHFEPNGDTPSGLAIVGVSLGMKKDGLVIHLTDGEHNVGQKPWNAHWILQKRGINLINLIWGREISQYNLQGMNYRQLNGLGDFPDALYQILVEQSKLSKMGGR